jgi:hypothetical protein
MRKNQLSHRADHCHHDEKNKSGRKPFSLRNSEESDFRSFLSAAKPMSFPARPSYDRLRFRARPGGPCAAK